MKRILTSLVAILLVSCGESGDSTQAAQQAANAALMRRDSAAVAVLLANDHSPEADRLRATAALQQGDPKGAATLLEAAVSRGGSAQAMADLARVRLILGDMAGARAMARRALDAAPGDLAPLLIAGELALRDNDAPAALGFFDRAAQRFPDNAAVLTGRAQALAELGKAEDLAKALLPLSTRFPDDPDVRALEDRLAELRAR